MLLLLVLLKRKFLERIDDLVELDFDGNFNAEYLLNQLTRLTIKWWPVSLSSSADQLKHDPEFPANLNEISHFYGCKLNEKKRIYEIMKFGRP